MVPELAKFLVGMLGFGQCPSLPAGPCLVLVWEDVVQGDKLTPGLGTYTLSLEEGSAGDKMRIVNLSYL